MAIALDGTSATGDATAQGLGADSHDIGLDALLVKGLGGLVEGLIGVGPLVGRSVG